MVDIKWFHPNDRVDFVGFRSGSKSAELSIHLSESDIRRLTNFGKKSQLRPSKVGKYFIWKGRITLMARVSPKKKKPSTKPKPAPPIPRGPTMRQVLSSPLGKPKKKRKSTGKLSEYNLFVKKHRLAGKSMKQIGALWRKKRR